MRGEEGGGDLDRHVGFGAEVADGAFSDVTLFTTCARVTLKCLLTFSVYRPSWTQEPLAVLLGSIISMLKMGSTCFVLPDAFDNDKQHAFSVTASEVVIMYEDRKGGKYQKSINPS